MNMYRKISMPRFVMEGRDLITVCSRAFKLVQLLIILKILSRRKPLSIENPAPTFINSSKEKDTTIASKTLKPSLT